MLLFTIYVLNAVALGRAVEEGQQHPMVFGNSNGPGNMPGGSLVTLCPESRNTDVLEIGRIVNWHLVPYLYASAKI